MGTNFHFCIEDKPIIHIGKINAAGLFCWDCGVSLCASGNHKVHCHQQWWLDECPICGQRPGKENSGNGSVSRKHGVKNCASFSWAISPSRFKDLRETPNLCIRNEYGELIEDFQAILEECPIMFFDNIGKEFC